MARQSSFSQYALDEMIRCVILWGVINIKTMTKGIVGFIVAIFIFLLIVVSYFYYKFGHEGIIVTIQNQTNSKISGLKITYQYSTKDLEIPEISANSTYKTVIDPTETFGENQLHLYYFDKNGLKVSEKLVGYFEKGYDGRVNVKIKKINQAGRMKMQIKDDVMP
jgi:hypothetical protein